MTSSIPMRSGPRPRSVWRDRVRVLADASGVSVQGLGELVEAELSRCEGVLFTATPAEDLDEISRWGRLAEAAWCGQVRAVVAAHNRMGVKDREFLGCEVSLALNISQGSADDLVATALLAASIPGLVEAVEAGMLTVRHVYAVLRALAGTGLSAEAEHAVVTIALARYTDQTPAQLGRVVAKLVLIVDAAAAAVREQDRTARRQIRFLAAPDGQGVLVARGPLAMIEAVRAALDATLPLATDPDDHRSRDAREFDLLVDLLTGGWDRVPQAAGAGGWTASIVIPYDVAAGADDELAEIPGLGPVLPGVAREVLARCATVTRIAVDANGRVLDVSSPLPGPAASTTDREPRSWLTDVTLFPLRASAPDSGGYRPGARLRRLIEARDRTCVFPGCARPAATTDLDHAIPWPRGSTSEANLHCLCRHHHRAKQAVFTVERLSDGTTRWTTRGGWTFDRLPQGY